MDYLDPKKRLQHTIILMTGYVLIGIGILIGATILLYQAYGFGLDKNGQVIRNGLVFMSSQPRPADIILNGKPNKSRTNTRLSLPAGSYTVRIERQGYRTWQRTIAVAGGDVQHFDYPFLFPATLDTKTIGNKYQASPGMTTQSPDHRWGLVEQAATATFDMYDLKNPSRAPVAVTIPDALLSKPATSQSWQPVEWANDNVHVLLAHTVDAKTEFIMFDRQNPDRSVNLNTALSANPAAISLNNKKYDQYYLLDTNAHTLQKATLSAPQPAPYLDHVLAYKSYAGDTVLYITDQNAPAGKVSARLQIGSKQYHLRDVVPAGSYALDIAGYGGNMYVVIGSAAEDRVYVYQDPEHQLAAAPKQVAVPLRVLRITGANFTSFSANTQFIAVENGPQLAVYDIEYNKAYYYTLSHAIDAPQPHVQWMDGDRLTYVSGGKLVVLDYDNANVQVLTAAAAAYSPMFAPDFKTLYTLNMTAAAQAQLVQTFLLTPADR